MSERFNAGAPLARRICLGLSLLLAIVLTLVGSKEMLDGLTSTGWTAVEGVILSSSLERKLGRHASSGTTTEYKAHVRYAYQVDGRRYENDRIHSHVQPASRDRSMKKKTLSLYPEGMKVTVYFQPGSPGNAVLQPGWSWRNCIFLVAGGVFWIIAAWLFLQARPGHQLTAFPEGT